MPNVLSPTAKQKFFGNDGRPLVGGKLFTYQAGTSIKTPTYTSSVGGANSNPVILDFRGEASVWIPPNESQKWVLAPTNDTDPPTNPIWTVDDIVDSQLLTLYGGVDVGISNQYILNFTASFSSYTDGIVIYWIPSNTNTGPSTINVNGLGPVNILNQDGSPLYLGQIVANQVTQIIYKGTGFLLITGDLLPTINTKDVNYTFALSDGNNIVQQTTNDTLLLYTIPTNAAVPFPLGTSIDVIAAGDAGITLIPDTGVTFYPFATFTPGNVLIGGHASTRIVKVAINTWIQFNQSNIGVTSGSFAPTWFGFSVNPAGNLSYYKIGSMVVLYTTAGLLGTSNSTSMEITNCPSEIYPSGLAAPVFLTDTGAVAAGMVGRNGLSTLQFYKGTAPPSLTGFTNSGSKGLPAGFAAIWFDA